MDSPFLFHEGRVFQGCFEGLRELHEFRLRTQKHKNKKKGRGKGRKDRMSKEWKHEQCIATGSSYSCIWISGLIWMHLKCLLAEGCLDLAVGLDG